MCYANCSKDEGRPLGRDLSGESAKRPLAAVHKGPSAGICQENLPSDLSLLCTKGMVVNGKRKRLEGTSHVGLRKMSEKRTADDVSIT